MSVTFPRDVDFESVREGWNRYQVIDDGVIIKNKITLRRITLVRIINNQPELSFDMNTVTETDEPPRINPADRSPQMSGIGIMELEPVNIKEPDDLDQKMRFNIITNIAQIYELKDGTLIRLAEKANVVWRTKKFDALGRRIYHLDLSTQINIFSPPPIA